MHSQTAPGRRPSIKHLVGMFSKVPRKVKLIIYLASFSAFGYGYLLILITAYLPELGVGLDYVGLIVGTTGLTFVLSAIPIGMLSDRKGRKPVLFSGLFALPPSLAVFGFTTDVTILLIAGVVAGVAEGAYLTSWNALIADETTVENRDAAFSLSFIVSNAAMGIGMAFPVVFPLLKSLTGLDTHTIHVGTLVVFALLALLSPILLWPVLRGHRDLKRVGGRRIEFRRLKPMLRFSAVNGLIGLGAGFIIPLMGAWFLKKFGVPDTVSGPLLAVANMTIALAAIVSSSLSRRYGQVRAIVMTQGSSMVFMLSLAFMPTAAMAGMVYLVRAALMNMSSPIADSFLMGIVHKEDRGVASAVNSLFWRLPNSATTIAGGIILESGNYDLPIFIAASFYAVGITLFYLFFRNMRPMSDEQRAQESGLPNK